MIPSYFRNLIKMDKYDPCKQGVLEFQHCYQSDIFKASYNLERLFCKNLLDLGETFLTFIRIINQLEKVFEGPNVSQLRMIPMLEFQDTQYSFVQKLFLYICVYLRTAKNTTAKFAQSRPPDKQKNLVKRNFQLVPLATYGRLDQAPIILTISSFFCPQNFHASPGHLHKITHIVLST